MEFYYPNLQNDFWRIMGLLFYGDVTHFLMKEKKGFDFPTIVNFLSEKGIAMYDAACEIKRLKGNASDKYLQVVKVSDIDGLLRKMPVCNAIAVTGEKAAQTLLSLYDVRLPAIGNSVKTVISERTVDVWRMPSTSRAYPLSLEEKSSFYRKLFDETGIAVGV